MRGFGIGVMAGFIAGAVGMCYAQQHKRGLKRNVGRALRNVGDLMDNVTNMF